MNTDIPRNIVGNDMSNINMNGRNTMHSGNNMMNLPMGNTPTPSIGTTGTTSMNPQPFLPPSNVPMMSSSSNIASSSTIPGPPYDTVPPSTNTTNSTVVMDNYRPLCSFDIQIPRGPDGRLGLSLHGSRTTTTNRTLVKVIGFSTYHDKVTNERLPYPAESTGLIQPGDILIGINYQSVIGRTVKELVPLLNPSSPMNKDSLSIQLRFIRPELGIRFRGIAYGNIALANLNARQSLNPQQLNSFYTVIVLYQQQIMVGPFMSGQQAALTFDTILLHALGYRTASATNYHRHLVPLVRKIELETQLMELRGNHQGAQQRLQQRLQASLLPLPTETVTDPLQHITYVSYGGELGSTAPIHEPSMVSVLCDWIHRSFPSVCVYATGVVEEIYKPHQLDVMIRHRVNSTHPGLALVNNPDWKQEQWEACGNIPRIPPPSQDTFVPVTSLSLNDLLHDTENKPFNSESYIQYTGNSKNDEDDGLGHIDAIKPSIVALPGNVIARGTAEHCRIGQTVQKNDSSIFPNLLWAFPYGPLFGPSYERSGVEAIGILEDLPLGNRTGQTTELIDVPLTGSGYPASKVPSSVPVTGFTTTLSSSSSSSSSLGTISSSINGGSLTSPSSSFSVPRSVINRIRGGLGLLHDIFTGVVWSKENNGAFAVYPSYPKLDELTDDDLLDTERGTENGFTVAYKRLTEEASKNVRVLGFYDTAVQAALAYDREVRRLYNSSSPGTGTTLSSLPSSDDASSLLVNFNLPPNEMNQLLTMVANNLRQGNAELFNLPKELLNGKACAKHIDAVTQSTLTDAKDFGQSGPTLPLPREHPLNIFPSSSPSYLFFHPFPSLVLQPTPKSEMDEIVPLSFMLPQGLSDVLKRQIAILKKYMAGDVPRIDELRNTVIVSNDRAESAPLKQRPLSYRGGSVRHDLKNNPFDLSAKKGGKKRGKGRKKRKPGDDDDEDDDFVDDQPSRRAGKGVNQNEARRSGRSNLSRKKLDEDDEQNEEEELTGSGSDNEPRNARPRPVKRRGANDDDENTRALPEDGVLEWKIEKLLGVRYADLPLSPADEAIENARPPPASPEEEERFQESLKLQLRMRHALPIDKRRGVNGWETLEYLLKWKGLSFLHAEWCQPALIKEHGTWGPIRAKRFLETEIAQVMIDEDEARMAEGKDWPNTTDYFEEDLVVVERVLAEKTILADTEPVGTLPTTAAGAVALYRLEFGDDDFDEENDPRGSNTGTKKLKNHPDEEDTRVKRTCYLIKWKGLPYSESSWEWAEDISDDNIIAQYKLHARMPLNFNSYRMRIDPRTDLDERPPPQNWRKYTEPPKFKNGRALRDYQLDGLNFMVKNWYNRRNTILADEMGLGKTVQTVSILHHLNNMERVRGPFLIIAPLSTLGHWKREFEEWTDLNCVYYHDPHGGNDARALIRKYEWYYPGEEGQQLARNNIFKFNVLLTSFHVLLADWEHIFPIRFRYVVVDEAHALKNKEGQLQLALQALKNDSLMLLTGTPLQNDVNELWSLMRLIRPEAFGSLEQFAATYGDLRTSEQVQALHKSLEPYMIRRVKEDVERSIPPKEETVIHVELTKVQKQYYRAIFERNRAFLMRGMGNAAPQSLISIEMELRKCCNHPFLLRSAEQREAAIIKTKAERLQSLINASGKTILLSKLLPKLKTEGHRVLIFSQFKIMLGLLEEFLSGCGYKYERIDGSIRGNERQAAIDRFNKPGSDSFAFLLSTKAGGQGINLTAADTVIIFDSDWNPQNDVQAMARVHRIGQTRDVRIYRLVTSKTYEAEMFRRASRKLGLSQAVFEAGKASSNSQSNDDGDGIGGGEFSGLLAMDKDKIEALLRFGAYAIAENDDSTNEASSSFVNASIDAILGEAVTVRYDSTGKAVGSEGTSGETTTSTNGNSSSSSSSSSSSRAPNNNSLSSATFRADDSVVDIQDPSFWEKVLGPKPADGLLADLSSTPSVLEDPTRLPQWVADSTALLDDVYYAKNENENHEAMETIASILVMLSVIGKRYPHPLSPLGRANMLKMGNGDTGLPPPSPTLASLLSAAALTAANARSQASLGRGPSPPEDEEGVQYDGTLGDFADWWSKKMDSSNRKRQRQRNEIYNKPVSVSSSNTPVLSGVRRGPGRPPGAMSGTTTKIKISQKVLEDTEEVDADGNIIKKVRMKKLREDGEGEKEYDPETGIPSISGIRIRLTRWSTNTLGVQYAPDLAEIAEREKTKEREALLTPNKKPPKVDIPAPTVPPRNMHLEALGIHYVVGSPQSYTATTVYKAPVLDSTMPLYLFKKTGYSRAQILTAASMNLSVQEYVASIESGTSLSSRSSNDNSSSSSSSSGSNSEPMEDATENALNDVANAKTLHEFNRAQTKRIATWLMMHRVSRATASQPILPIPHPIAKPFPGLTNLSTLNKPPAYVRRPANQPFDPDRIETMEAENTDGTDTSTTVNEDNNTSGSNDIDADEFDFEASVALIPMRVQAVYSSLDLRLNKPDRVRGPRMVAPMWVLEGRPVDAFDEQRRMDRKSTIQTKREFIKAAANKAKSSKAATASTVTGEGTMDDDVDDEEEAALLAAAEEEEELMGEGGDGLDNDSNNMEEEDD